MSELYSILTELKKYLDDQKDEILKLRQRVSNLEDWIEDHHGVVPILEED